MAKPIAELNKLRTDLVSRIQASDLVWKTVSLKFGVAIEVTSPVVKDGYYVPATAKEVWALAAKFQVLPLTRAVADQTHNAARYVPRKPMNPSTQIYDFELYSDYLKNPAKYGDGALASGAHKFWVLSAMRGIDPRAINYGFHIETKHWKGLERGPYLNPAYTVIQGLGGRHNGDHWDYSQLIQFMRNLTPTAGFVGPPSDLRQALLDGNPAVWDEAPAKLTADKLPF